MLVHLLAFAALHYLSIGIGVAASPLTPTFTSCLSSFSPVADGQHLLNVTNIYAEIISGSEAAQLGLAGGGHNVLRVDLVGVTGSEVVGYDNTTNKLATLFTDTRAATFNVYSSTSWLCNSLFPSELSTPYYPYNTTYCPLPAGDFAINLTIPLYSSYALTTLHTQVRVVDTSAEANNLACIDVHVSPYRKKGWYYRIFLWLPVAVAVGLWAVSWGARFLTGWIVGSGVAEYGQKEAQGLAGVGGNKRDARMRKWGTMIISGLSGERLSVSGGLLRFVTPGLKDVLFHIQYCTALGMIAVNWPDFSYPIFARGAWADLVWNTTLVQGSNPGSKLINAYPTDYTPSSAFATQMNDPQYPLYLDANAVNPVLDLHNASHGMESFATAVGLRPQDLFGTCMVIFLAITAAICAFSLLLWFIHGLAEYASLGRSNGVTARTNKRSSLGSSPRGSLGGKEVYDPRNPSSYSDGAPNLSSQSALAVQKASAPSRFRRIWFRFRLKGEAGAFHAAALEGNLLRLILTFHFPITIFSMYQLTLASRASIVSRVFAALSFAFISVLIPAFVLWRISRTPTGKLYDATRTLLSLGPLYNIYVEKKQMYRVLPLTASLIAGIVIGAGQRSGIAQAIIIIIVELVMLILPGVWYPWGDGASMGAPSTFLSALRLISVLLVMLLAPTIGMSETAADWIAYAIFILQAITFIFFLLMLVTKVIEGIIRLVGGVHFDESTHQLDGGIFAAIMDLDCLNPVRGGKAAERRRRKHGSRQLQRNVSAQGSLTTQMMLDRHSLGVPRQPNSNGQTPFLTPYDDRSSYLPGQQPPLGPPPLDRHSSESKSDERAGDNIMDAWRPPVVPAGYAPPGGYVPTATDTPPKGQDQGQPSRTFSVVRGGRADFENPYEVLRDAGPSRDSPIPLPMGVGNRRSMDSPIRVAQVGNRPMSPPAHNRHQSSHGVLDFSAPGPALALGPSRSPPATTPAPTAVYPPTSPSREPGIRSNNEGLRPPALAIPKRRSLNDLKHDPSPDSQYSDSIKANTRKGKKGKGRKSGGWFGTHRHDAAATPDTASDSDSEPGPSRKRRSKGGMKYREPAPFEDVPLSPEMEPETGRTPAWRKALGLRRKKSLDEFAAAAKDENKARKAALAAESGALFAGVEAPTPSPQKGFTVHRRAAPQGQISTWTSTSSMTGMGSSTPDQRAEAQAEGGGSKGFKVKRMGQTTPAPVNVLAPRPASIHPSPDPSRATGNGNSSNGSADTSANSTPGAHYAALRSVQMPSPAAATGGQNTNSIGAGGQTQTQTQKKTFKVLRPAAPRSPSSSVSFVVNRPAASTSTQPTTSTSPTLNINTSTNTDSTSYPPNAGAGTGTGTGPFTSNIIPPTPTMGEQPEHPPIPSASGSDARAGAAAQAGYPPSSFVPLGKTISSSSYTSGAPERPAKNPRRPSQESARGVF